MRIEHLFLATACLSGGPAFADQLRDYCPDRPGLATPSCIVDRGHVSLEIGLADWTLDKMADMRSDQILTGDYLARLGVTHSTEIQIGWTSYGRLRTRDRTTGSVQVQHRTGDITLGISQNIRNPDGSGYSVSVLPSVTLPVGRSPIGAGDWGAGVRLPVSIALNDVFSLGLTPEMDAAVDADGEGRHLAYGSVAGLAMKVSESVTATLEYMAMRDHDPDRTVRSTQSLASLSVGWQPTDDLQFDIGSVAGLNRQTADIEVYAGISRRF
jgi:hypothetical protein